MFSSLQWNLVLGSSDHLPQPNWKNHIHLRLFICHWLHTALTVETNNDAKWSRSAQTIQNKLAWNNGNVCADWTLADGLDETFGWFHTSKIITVQQLIQSWTMIINQRLYWRIQNILSLVYLVYMFVISLQSTLRNPGRKLCISTNHSSFPHKNITLMESSISTNKSWGLQLVVSSQTLVLAEVSAC